jgi:serine/threonine protein kinase
MSRIGRTAPTPHLTHIEAGNRMAAQKGGARDVQDVAWLIAPRSLPRAENAQSRKELLRNAECWPSLVVATRASETTEFVAGTLAYMAPKQTGRMNRSIDSRSDLYSLGVTLYEVLTGSLPFTASDPMERVHCHIARQPVSPSERLKTVPATVSALIIKLLAKTAEERYQTATGVQSDLRRPFLCLERRSG